MSSGRLLVPLAVGVATLLVQLPFFDRWVSAMDEGHMVQFADLVAQGGVLYRDATIYPLPGAFYLLALVFRVFEPSILVSRWLVSIEFALFVALIVFWLRGWLRPSGVVAAVLALWIYRLWAFPHWQIYSYSTTALLLFAVVLVLASAFFESGRLRTLAFAGLVFGLGVFCKQDYGAVVLLGIVFSLGVYATRPFAVAGFGRLMAWFLAPAAAVGAAAGLHFAWLGVLPDVIQMAVLNPFEARALGFEYTRFPALLPLFAKDPTFRDPSIAFSYLPGIIFTVHTVAIFNTPLFRETAIVDTLLKVFYFGPFLLIGFGAWRLFRTRSAGDDPQRRWLREVLLWSHAAGFLLLAWWQLPQDYLHLAVLYWPVLLLLVVRLGSPARPSGVATRAARVLAGGLVLLMAVYSVQLVLGLRDRLHEPIPLARAGTHAQPLQARMLREVVDYVHAETRSEDPLAVMPYAPLYHFLSDRKAPHRLSYVMWPFPEFPDRDRKIIEALERHRSELILYDSIQFRGFPPFSEYVPELFHYLVENFHVDRVFAYPGPNGGIIGAKRTHERPVGRPLSLPDAPERRVWIEGPDGRPIDPAVESGVLLREEEWPFRPVWALRPSAAGASTVLEVPVDVPPGGRLRTAIGVHPRFFFRFRPTSITFSIEAGDGAEAREIFSRTLDPHRKPAERGWFEVEVGLEPWAGRRVPLRFRTATEHELGENPWAGGWGAPRVLELGAAAPPDHSR